MDNSPTSVTNYTEMEHVINNQVSNCFNICHLNVRSLSKNIDNVRTFLHQLSLQNVMVDIRCVSETWLTDDMDKTLVKISNYKLFEKHRTNKKGGGVAI